MLCVERLHDSIPLSAVILNHLNGKKHCHCLFSRGGGGGLLILCGLRYKCFPHCSRKVNREGRPCLKVFTKNI